MQRYIMKYPDGKYVGIDEMSGGYPYPTESFFFAGLWPSAEAAAKYREIGKRPFTIHKIMALVTSPVQEVTKTVPVVSFEDPTL